MDNENLTGRNSGWINLLCRREKDAVFLLSAAQNLISFRASF
jgi:hypothetical protein